MRDEQKRAEIYETQLLNKTQEQIIKAEAQKMLQNRLFFKQNELEIQKREEKEFQEREKWRMKIDEKAAAAPVPAQPSISATPMQPSPKKKVILIMTVDIGDGRVDTIKVREGDDFASLAQAFQKKHGLVAEVVGPLSEHIRQNVDNISKKKPASPIQQPTVAPAASKSNTSNISVKSEINPLQQALNSSSPFKKPTTNSNPFFTVRLKFTNLYYRRKTMTCTLANAHHQHLRIPKVTNQQLTRTVVKLLTSSEHQRLAFNKTYRLMGSLILFLVCIYSTARECSWTKETLGR